MDAADDIKQRFNRLRSKPQQQNEADAERQLTKEYLLQYHRNNSEQQKNTSSSAMNTEDLIFNKLSTLKGVYSIYTDYALKKILSNYQFWF